MNGDVVMNNTLTQPLRDEHRHLLPHIEALRKAADTVGHVPLPTLRSAVVESLEFLTKHLIPHAVAEDEVLYVKIDQLLGGVPVTATMRRDHVEVVRLTHRLDELEATLSEPVAEETERELRQVLYGLYAIVALHFAKEEEVYLPILDERLTPQDAEHLFRQLGHAHHHAAAAGHEH